MLENDEIVDQFKKSLSATIKSIGKSNTIEVNFVQDGPSIDGDIINLNEPNLQSLKKNLNYMRAEADSMALEIRLHTKEIHQEYLGNNDVVNEIFNAVEQSRIEAQGSHIFKGIKLNILNKHKFDIQNTEDKNNKDKEDYKEIIEAFRYVSYSELTGEILGGKFSAYKKLIQKKLGHEYNDFFKKLRNNITNQKNFADLLQTFLDNLGYYDHNNKQDGIDNEDSSKDKDLHDEDNKSKNQDSKTDTKHDDEASSSDLQQASSMDEDQKMGDEANENDLEYFPKIESLDNKMDKIKSEYLEDLDQIDNDKEFIRKSNRGVECMAEDNQKRVAEIGNYTWVLDGTEIPFLDETEVRNLQIQKGTLLPEEREIINEHIVITIEMLEKLPYPKKLRNVPEFAGGHHEKLNGTGYPKGLKDEDMSIQAKIMAISDIYEALTAKDRPYKDGYKLSEAMEIMWLMKNNSEIDKDLFDIFIKKEVYQEYADTYLGDDQIDDIDEASLIG